MCNHQLNKENSLYHTIVFFFNNQMNQQQLFFQWKEN